MDVNEEVLKLGVSLASYIGQSSVQSIRDKLRLARTSSNKDEAIGQLEEIILELIQEKNELITLAQAYDEQLAMRKISDEDIEYITDSLVPLIEKLIAESGGEDAEKMRASMDVITPLLSKDTFNILQLLGFNFKQAIGEPLTQLVRDFIISQSPVHSDKTLEYKISNERRVTEYLKVLQDEAAYKKLVDESKNK